VPDLDTAHPSLDDALERLIVTPTVRRSRAAAGQRSETASVPASTNPSFVGDALAGGAPFLSEGVSARGRADAGRSERDPLREGIDSVPQDGINWDLVTMLRQQAAERLTSRELARPELDQGAREEMGRSVIAEVLREHADSAIGVGDNFTPDQEQKVAKALFDMLYRAGRLQPLLDVVGVENIRIQGCDNVMVRVAGSQWQAAPPVARSDQELIETLQFLATRSGQSERAFTASNPHLHMVLPGGARLAANGWTTPRPVVTIRIHRHVDVDLDDLVDLGMLDESIAQFLRACVSARKSIMVAGDQSAGKTTLLRALANELDPWESIATIETEYELFLHQSPERHRLILAMEARSGTGERQADGTRSGEVTLTDHLESSLRHSLTRIIVGECRGPEVGPMLQAMQAGAGAMSTVHAVSADKTVQRLVTMLANYMPNATPNFALMQIASSIDVIVQLRVMPTHSGGGYRYVSEVIQLNGLADGATGMADTTHVFAPGEDRRALPAHQPTWLSDLEDVGFDPGWLTPGVGYWPELEPLLGLDGDDLDMDQDADGYDEALSVGGAR